MKQILLIAGAAALAIAGPAVAKPGHGQDTAIRSAYGTHGNVGYGVGGCPPGLAKKNNGCMPPGQAKKLYAGQRFASQLWRPLRLSVRSLMTCATATTSIRGIVIITATAISIRSIREPMLIQQVISASPALIAVRLRRRGRPGNARAAFSLRRCAC